LSFCQDEKIAKELFSIFMLVAFITFDILQKSNAAGSITIFLHLKVGLPAIHSVIEPAAYKKACTKSNTNLLFDSQKPTQIPYKYFSN